MVQKENLHPSVKQFKEFVHQHPLIMKEVSNQKKSLQEFFEEWSVLGPEHEQWEQYKLNSESETKSVEQPESESDSEEGNSKGLNETFGQLFNVLKQMNVQDLQAHLSQFSSVLANIQQVMQSFQRPTSDKQNHQQDSDPFSFRRD
ncbi:spore coat protein YlbD [Halalkalibacter urbisdiaboli]|uniref:spore coat protein YlbD n=1 Tax=Halalkalibacter urbisdiaboli TaxID=1960589 RepID=UPI000B44D5EB|nr:spore coat protein YlbD [Halalkalibacter urbisdiaboli]